MSHRDRPAPCPIHPLIGVACFHVEHSDGTAACYMTREQLAEHSTLTPEDFEAQYDEA